SFWEPPGTARSQNWWFMTQRDQSGCRIITTRHAIATSGFALWVRCSRLRKGKLKDHNSTRRSVAWLASLGFAVGMLNPAAQSAGRNDQPLTQNLPPPVHLTAEQDRQRTMELLHIDVLRSGPQSNPGLPNPANYDESKVDPSVKVPDPLVLNDGKKVT